MQRAAEQLSEPRTGVPSAIGRDAPLEVLIRAHEAWLKGRVRTLLRRRGLGSRVAEEDVTQGVYARLTRWWRDHAAEDLQNQRGLLSRLAECEVNDLCRKRYAKKRGGPASSCRSVPLDAASDVPTSEHTPTFQARLREFLERVEHLLSPRQCEILIKVGLGLEVAGISRRRVSRIVNCVRRKLRAADYAA